MNTVWPEQAAVQAAAAKAEATLAASACPAGVKVMLPSHVASGFWLQVQPCPPPNSLHSTRVEEASPGPRGAREA